LKRLLVSYAEVNKAGIMVFPSIWLPDDWSWFWQTGEGVRSVNFFGAL